MISRLVEALKNIDSELTAEDIADTLWLAQQMSQSNSEAAEVKTLPGSDTEASPPAETSPLQDSTEVLRKQSAAEQSLTTHTLLSANSSLFLGPKLETGGRIQSKSLSTKGSLTTALPRALDIARALRPLKRQVPSRTNFVLNEKITTERIIEEGLWTPVLSSAFTRWFEIALVVDEGASMAIWRETIAELYLLLQNNGAFRDVRKWGLVTDASDGIAQVYAETSQGLRRQQARNPDELTDPSGRRLILVITDCVSPAWRTGFITSLLTKWGRSNLVTILQVLPKRLWSRTSLDAAIPVRLSTPSPAAPNRRLKVLPLNDWESEGSSAGLPIPIVTLEPNSIADWAQMVARAGSTAIPGFRFGNISQEAEVFGSLSAVERVQRFRALASPMARKLAGLLSATPVTLSIVNLIQQTMLPESRLEHVAEIFLGGLLKEIPSDKESTPSGDVQYEFFDGVRDLLLDSVPVSDSIQVLKEVSDFVASSAGQSLDFSALLMDPLSTEEITINKDSQALTTVAAKVLQRLGGRYASLAAQLEKISSEPQSLLADPLVDREANTPRRVPQRKKVPKQVIVSSRHENERRRNELEQYLDIMQWLVPVMVGVTA
jgi:hypothetical protein